MHSIYILSNYTINTGLVSIFVKEYPNKNRVFTKEGQSCIISNWQATDVPQALKGDSSKGNSLSNKNIKFQGVYLKFYTLIGVGK